MDPSASSDINQTDDSPDKYVEPLISNQIEPNMIQLTNLKKALKSKEEFICCPYCKKSALTETKKTVSTKSILLCFFSIGLPWLFIQLCRKKDINFYDAEHFCSKCSQHIVDYQSC